MVSGKEAKTKKSNKNPKPHKQLTKKQKKQPPTKATSSDFASASEQLYFFVNEFQSANALHLSSLELQPIKETSFVELSKEVGQDVDSLGKQMKAAFASSWKEALCQKQLVDGKIEAGSPAVLIITTSALRVIELLRGVRSLTIQCHAAKLFSKHMKVEEQVTLLKERVNFASGTPSRIKKLIDIEALGLSRLDMVVLDIHTDVKGYSLLTLPQVRDEFWDLYKNYFHQRLLQGDLRICLFGPLPNGNILRGKKKKATDE
ncbi:uncharacterized protein LOC126670906 [Mercurialis annua]|uniref:uncharacterized protein LOC126670906 n=1 Tax=Mercurialis annua TaxID=3986 RepID=UPI002160A25D|nr:uncharacterized protein LOC126670906 [Mercurialis annua]